jgi:hypothetical protein
MAWSRIIACAASTLGLATALGAATTAQASVTISSAASKNISCSSGVCTPTTADAVLNVADLTTMLASSVVSVNTGGALASDIDVKEGFSWASANGLTLDAYRSITVEKAVSDSGTASLALLTNDGGSGGALSFATKGSISFLGTGNALSINGNAYTLENSVASLASAIAANPSGFYALANSYDASADGAYKTSPIATTLTGTFEGLGNTISNLTIHFHGHKGVAAFFETIGSSGVVNDIRLTHEQLRAYHTGGGASGLAGSNYGSMSADTVAATFKAENCYCGFAGLVSGNFGVITTSSASVNISTLADGSGFVGSNLGTITLSSSQGTVASLGTPNVAVGGFATGNFGTINESFSSVSVSASDQSTVGGLVGEDEGTTTNSYATGAVTGGNSSMVGGLVGYAVDVIQSSYSTGAVNAGNASGVGGFIGEDEHSEMTDCYWDTTTSGTDQGTGNGNEPDLTGLTTQQLQAGLPVGFDKKIWAENPNINGGLPYLKANPPQ